jgi:hypothetical protein
MSSFRRLLPLLVAVTLLGLAVLLALFAVDVRAWQGRVTGDDLRFRAAQSRLGLWHSPMRSRTGRVWTSSGSAASA